jgi:hypothetical protein
MKQKRLNSELLYSKIKLRHSASEQEFLKTHPQAYNFFKLKQLLPGKIREHATNLLASGAIAGSLLVNSPQAQVPINQSNNVAVFLSESSIDNSLANNLSAILPQKIAPLSSDQELKISGIIKKVLGINAYSELEGNKLNHSYGLIGAEQHLPRFPGDSVEQHDEYQRSGITPGLGAWGYFANSKSNLTYDLIEKEKYYVAVQTLYLQDWNTNFEYLRDWYKHRKVIVINPVNGKAVVAVIADAGPAEWTGKHFGGSPEVMAQLKLNVGMQKGPVVLYFVDDPEDKVSLGPINYNVIKSPLLVKNF